jgi:hypothetical protein
MKKNFFMQIVTVLIFSVSVSSCNRPGKQAGDVASDNEAATSNVEVFDTEKIKNQLIEIIRESPHPVEIANLINESKASYISDLTIQQDDYEKLMTSTQKAFGIGLLAFDSKYSSVYNRTDDFLKIRDNASKLKTDLGLQDVFLEAKKFEERIKQNKSDADSLKYLVSKIFENYHQNMQEGENADVYALSFIGADIEALYVLSQMTIMAENNEKLLDILNNQHELVESVASLMEVMSDMENVKPYHEKIQPVVKFFAEKDIITTADVKEIAPLIEDARNSMIQL